MPQADADDVVILTQIQTRELLRALTRKSEILVINDRNQETKLSDKGAAAVLLKMDEFQGRLGTQGALIRKGNRDEAGVLKALPILVVHIPEPAPRAGDAKIAEDPSREASPNATTLLKFRHLLAARGRICRLMPQMLAV